MSKTGAIFTIYLAKNYKAVFITKYGYSWEICQKEEGSKYNGFYFVEETNENVSLSFYCDIAIYC